MLYPKGVLLALTALLSVRSNPHQMPTSALRNKTHLERARGIGWGFKDLNDMRALSSLGWWYNWCADGVARAALHAYAAPTGGYRQVKSSWNSVRSLIWSLYQCNGRSGGSTI